MKVMLWHWGRRGGGPHYTLELARELRKLDDLEIHLSLSRQSEFGRIRALAAGFTSILTTSSRPDSPWCAFRESAMISGGILQRTISKWLCAP